MHRPAVLGPSLDPAFPAHLLPTVALEHVRHVAWIASVVSHPVRKRHVMRQQRGIVASCRQPGGLSILAHIEEADRDSVKSLGRGCGKHLAGRDRVSGKQQMAI